MRRRQRSGSTAQWRAVVADVRVRVEGPRWNVPGARVATARILSAPTYWSRLPDNLPSLWRCRPTVRLRARAGIQRSFARRQAIPTTLLEELVSGTTWVEL